MFFYIKATSYLIILQEKKYCSSFSPTFQIGYWESSLKIGLNGNGRQQLVTFMKVQSGELLCNWKLGSHVVHFLDNSENKMLF